MHNYFELKNIQIDRSSNSISTQAIIANYYLLSLKNNNIKINSGAILRDNNDSICPLYEKCISKRTLIFRYTSMHCSSCVDTIMKLIDVFAEEIGREKILILSQYSNKRDYKNYIRINQIKQKIYDVKETISVADTFDTPYIFILEDDLLCNNFYIPRKESTEYIKLYLNSVKHLLK